MGNALLDANIYLRLYDVGGGLKKLLPALATPPMEIFVSTQVRDEVLRNRVAVAASSFAEHLRQLPTLSPPEPLLHGLESNVEGSLKDAYKKLKELKSEVQTVVESRLGSIARGEDEISKGLDAVFAHAMTPTDAQLARARLRKELGGPPGKFSDPLGDQLTWEQFVDQLDPKGPVFVVTTDRDFGPKVGDTSYLHPNLTLELKAKGVSTIYVFDSLAKSLPKMKEVNHAHTTLPSTEELAEIEKDETRGHSRPTSRWAVAGDPTHCPQCKSDRISLVPKPSQFGGWGYHLFCDACRYHVDTGIPYDD